jgi:hypothetical protein
LFNLREKFICLSFGFQPGAERLTIAKWTAKFDPLMEEDSRFLYEYDKLQVGMELALGDKRYLLNPFQMMSYLWKYEKFGKHEPACSSDTSYHYPA